MTRRRIIETKPPELPFKTGALVALRVPSKVRGIVLATAHEKVCVRWQGKHITTLCSPDVLVLADDGDDDANEGHHDDTEEESE